MGHAATPISHDARGTLGERGVVRLGYALGVGSAALLVLLCFAYVRGITPPAWAWIPEAGIRVSLRLDALGVLFGGLVTGIGALVLAYAGHYMAHEPRPGRFLVTLAAFLLAMLGLVLADDLFAVFLFWELTSVTSFLLIGQTRTEQAKRGATQALLVTGIGGVCLLAAAVLIRQAVGTSSLSELVLLGDALRQSPMYGAIFALLAAGCLSKSAQFPLHFWLPDSMAAPTPASAFLHSATMVKAGIYLLLRFEPIMGGTVAWASTLVAAGGTTMLLGAYQGLRQNDLKALLAYSTLSQLGTLTLLLGLGGDKARAAVVAGIVAHAAYKSSLFLTAGAVDHAAGTRELTRLGGLRKHMPVTAVFAALSAASMAGLAPLAGFVAKEKFLALGLGSTWGWLLLAAGAVVGALLLAQAGRLWFGTFAGDPSPDAPEDAHPHEAHPAMLLAIGLPALAGVLLPWLAVLSPLLSGAAGAKVDLFPWHGVNVELVVSTLAVIAGVGLYLGRDKVMHLQDRLHTGAIARGAFELAVAGVDRLAWLATRVQSGDLRLYLCVMLAATGGLLMALGSLPLPSTWPTLIVDGRGVTADASLAVLRGFTLLLVVVSSLASVLLRRDLFAILALGASGVAMALLFALEPAPDVALVMVVVDLLTVVILVLAITKLPAARRATVVQADERSPWKYLHAAFAIVAGVVVSLLALHMLDGRPRESRPTPFYEAAAKPLVGSDDIVGSIVIDFRGFDTLIEIAVFGMGGLGVYALLRYASRTAGDRAEPIPRYTPRLPSSISGIGGLRTSPLLRVLAQIMLPVCLVVSATHIMFGHNGPGDGFTAGVIAALGVSFRFAMLGYEQTRRTLTWLRPTLLIGAGILLVVGAKSLSGYLSGAHAFFAPFDFGAAIGLAPYLPYGFAITNSLFFELAICLTVLGAASHVIDTLGHPTDYDDAAAETDAIPFSLEEYTPMIPYRPGPAAAIDPDEDVAPLVRAGDEAKEVRP